MGGPTNDHDCDHKSRPLSSPPWPESPSVSQKPNLSDQKSNQEAKHAVSPSTKSSIARRQTIHNFRRRTHEGCPPANNGVSPLTRKTEWPMVSRSTSLNSKHRAGLLVVSKAQQSRRDLVSRFRSPNTERRSSLPGQLSSGEDLSKTACLEEQSCVPSQPDGPSRLPELPGSAPRMSPSTYVSSSPSLRLTLMRLSSLDQFMSYQEEKKLRKCHSLVPFASQLPKSDNGKNQPTAAAPASWDVQEFPQTFVEKWSIAVERELDPTPESSSEQNKFRHFAAEVGFCFTVAMTQLLAEYLIAGFAIVLPNIYQVDSGEGAGTTGLFWPAALLSLILSAFLLTFARVSDMCGGYGPFMLGLIWLTIWTLIPGFVSSSLLLNVSRANQGLAIAAFTPSTFSMVGSIYPEGPRRNVVLGLYGACAPLGFFAGFLAGGALPIDESRWYFWIASALAFTTTVTAYLSVPHDKTDRRRLGLKMDWLGAGLITSGLILVTYALSVQPYANVDDPTKNGFTFRIVYAPLLSGAGCLSTAFWMEGWYASCPLLPFEFFKPQGVKPFSLACLFFYGSFGVWLYNSAE